MKMVRVAAIFLILMMVKVHQGSAGVSDIWTVIKFSYDVSSKIIEGKSAYALLTDRTSQKLDDIYSAVQNIMRDQQMIAKRLEANVQKMMNNLRKQIRNDVEFDRLREKITQEYIARINNIHKTFTDAIDRNYNNITMCDLAIETTSFGSHEIHDSLGKTSQLIFTEGTMSSYFSNFIDILLEHTQGETKDRCNKGMSQQQEVYQFYELLVETEKKAFTVLSLAYSFKSRCLKANFENELKGVQTDMIKRVVQYMKIIKKAMAKVSTEIRRCEPTEYIRNENFIELERYIRMIIMPENETETFPVPSKCSGTCNEYHKIGAPFFGSEVSRRHTILAQNCEKCESIGYTQICYPKDENTSRYYEGVKANIPNSTPNSEYGHFSKCYTRRQETFIKDVDSFFYTIGAMCDMCACKCLNPEPNQKWLYSIYLRGQEADIANNMVVTGIRFNHRHAEHTGHLIYPEIKVGKLLPYGEVTDGEWQGFQGPDYPFQPLDFRTDQYATFGTLPDQIHYVNLDNAFADPGQVVVGVRFVMWEDTYRIRRPEYITYNDRGLSVGLTVRMVPFNFTTGKLNRFPTTYFQPDSHVDITLIRPGIYKEISRQEIYLEYRDVPTKSKNTKPYSHDRQYLRFTMSDKEKDFGQTTVPFIDIQPVETSPPAPLSGIGLFYKTEPGYGGFLALKLMTLNMTDVIETDIPEAEKIKLGL